MAQSPSFSNKVVLITGGSGGIGKAIAVYFLKNGANVAINGRSAPKGEQASKEILAQDKLKFIQADVSKDDQAAHLVAATVETFGRLDVCVANAGLGGPAGLLGSLPPGPVAVDPFHPDWNQDPIINNVYACLNVCKYAIKHWTADFSKLRYAQGIIVATSSLNGLEATPNCAMYGASKHAIIGLVTSIAKEYARKGSLPFMNPKEILDWASTVPLGRLGTLRDAVAKLPAVAELLADPIRLNNTIPRQFASMVVPDSQFHDYMTIATMLKSIQGPPITVRANLVAPGLIDAPLTWNQAKEGLMLAGWQEVSFAAQGEQITHQEFTDTAAPAFASGLPGGRIGRPDEVANVVGFLASPAASYINGTVVRVDDGLGS